MRGRISPLRDSMLGASSGDGQACRPLVDVSETDDGYVLEVEVPG
ncbi:small heat shock protein [Rhodococcus wratislaviensis IFP 2016]|nr:small heat shock protein [Rhodococcus wratislaviensis IFP 2016]